MLVNIAWDFAAMTHRQFCLMSFRKVPLKQRFYPILA
jgi:hypothetical protein